MRRNSGKNPTLAGGLVALNGREGASLACAGAMAPRISVLYLMMALALAAPAAARADTVTMRDGDRFSGTVKHMSAGSLTLESAYAGDITLPWGEITRISTDKPVTLILKDAQGPQSGALAPGIQGSFLLQSGGAQQAPRVIGFSSVLFLNPTPSESGSGVEYKRHVAISGSRTQGNSEGSSGAFEGQIDARAKTYRYAVRGMANQTRLGGETVSSNWLLSAHLDRFVVDQKHFQYVRSSVQRDRFKDIRLRTALGAGYGWQLIDDGVTELTLRGGLDLVSVDHYASERDGYPALGWGVQFSHWMLQHRLKLFFDQDGYWGLGASAEVTVRTRTGLRVPIAQGLLATAQLDVDWDRHPAPGVKPTDSTLMVGLGYEW
ncbi:MAG: DUF481 domain-containing protein [Burkholderiales bacterium]